VEPMLACGLQGNHARWGLIQVFAGLTCFACQLCENVTVAHRGKTQLNFSSEKQQSFGEHNNLLENTTIFWRTQQSFGEHNNLLENTTIFSRTPQSFSEHNEIS